MDVLLAVLLGAVIFPVIVIAQFVSQIRLVLTPKMGISLIRLMI